MLSLWMWLQSNYMQMGEVLGLAVALAEAIVRLTPTTVDDGAVHRIGAYIDKLLDLLHIPSIKKKVE